MNRLAFLGRVIFTFEHSQRFVVRDEVDPMTLVATYKIEDRRESYEARPVSVWCSPELISDLFEVIKKPADAVWFYAARALDPRDIESIRDEEANRSYECQHTVDGITFCDELFEYFKPDGVKDSAIRDSLYHNFSVGGFYKAISEKDEWKCIGWRFAP